MMRYVPRDDKGQRAHRKGIAARDPRPYPSLRRHIGEKRNRREPHMTELLDVAGPGELICRRASRRNVLIVAGQRSLKTARKPQSSKRKRPLCIADMIQHLS